MLWPRFSFGNAGGAWDSMCCQWAVCRRGIESIAARSNVYPVHCFLPVALNSQAAEDSAHDSSGGHGNGGGAEGGPPPLVFEDDTPPMLGRKASVYGGFAAGQGTAETEA